MVRGHVAPRLDGWRMGFAWPRNVVTFTSLIDCHGRQGDLVAAELWLQRLTNCELQPTVVSYGALLRGYAGLGEVLEAAKALRSMAVSQLALDVPAFTSLMKACGRKRWDVALPGSREGRCLGLEGAPCAACGSCT